MAATYVYAVIPAVHDVSLDVPGVGDDADAQTVQCIVHGDLAAVVSASPVVEFRGLRRDEAVRHLLAHQRVVEAVMRRLPLLPVKFGTVLASQDAARRLLAQGKRLLRSALRRFAALTQVEVVVLWDVQRVFREIAEESPIARLKAAIGERSLGEAEPERVAIGQMVQASLVRRREALRQRLVACLQDVGLDLVANPVMDDSMAANVAVLVNEVGRQALDVRLELLDKQFNGGLQIRCVGPLPPYSFATVEVQQPSFEAIDDARQRLGLNDAATADEIKRAYRRLARQLHPDQNRGDPEADSRMGDLTYAYELLSTYAHSQALGGRAARRSYCRFDRRTVEQTLLIAVRRQETDLQQLG